MQNQQQQHFYIELSALTDLRVLLFATGCQAAQRLWGTIPEVPAKRFADAGRAVLPCMLRPAQVPLLVRLMADEGIVGEWGAERSDTTTKSSLIRRGRHSQRIMAMLPRCALCRCN